jgi:hypothetical protein
LYSWDHQRSLLDALLYHHHRDVIVYFGIWLHGNSSKGTTRTSPADARPKRRRKTKSELV